MIDIKTNIVLVGMPGAGKSTVGVILAKRTSKSFVDTDILIQESQKRTLQEIVNIDGYLALRRIEEDVLLGLSVSNSIIATGGSAVYSDRAMSYLNLFSHVIFIDVGISILEYRVQNYTTRGLAKHPDQSFTDMFHERIKLYKKYSGLSIKCDGMSQDEVSLSIIDRIERYTDK